ncbi:hypothetical protein LJC58_06345 [Lachnospiraceae bacterium OttesenSCG-928-D06]|nr:hypothetical protein [Lachnospiraceae bacterium OttesenSCG-928-D06]
MKKYYIVLCCLIGCVFATFLLLHNNGTEKEKSILMKERSINSLSEQIKNGDFSSVKISNNTNVEEMKRIYEKQNKKDNIEWVLYDINDDGIEELVWKEKESYNQNIKRIVGIFLFHIEGAECIVWDINDSTEYMFLSIDGNIIYYTQYYGIYDYIGYENYFFDKDWNKILVCGLYVYNVDEPSAFDEWWKEEYPYITDTGVYYVKSIIDTDGIEYTEKVEKDKFMEIFKENCGMSLYDLEPEWNIY